MADEVGEIRARINIVDLVGQSVSLRKIGNRFQGLCPFHQDHNPSFNVSPETGRYKCWACGESGDVFNWVMKTRNVEFKEALQILAEQAGVALSRQNPKDRSVRLMQRSAMEAALGFFREQLGKCNEARAYCEKRALGPDIVDRWELGYAPDMDEALTAVLLKQGFRLADCKTLFLLEGDESNGYRAKFRSRLMFPIRDEKGDLVAFGGRLLGDGIPKYINSSDTPLFKKGKTLYGMHLAKEAMRSRREAVLVEGNIDVIACHSAGVDFAVASLGTALSEDQAKLLKRWCDSVTILYDSDAAGQKASARAADILLAEGLRIKVASVPEGKDPDTLLRSAGPEAVKAAAAGGLSPLEYRIRQLEISHDVAQDDFWKLAAEEIAKEQSEFERLRFIENLAMKHPHIRDVGAARQALTRTVESARKGAVTPALATAVVAARQSGTPFFKTSEAVIFRAFLDPEYRKAVWPVMQDEDLFLTKAGRTMARRLVAAFPEAPIGHAREWLEQIEDSTVKDLLQAVEEDARLRLTPQFVEDAIQNLYRKLDEREVARLRSGEGDDKLADIVRILQRHKS